MAVVVTLYCIFLSLTLLSIDKIMNDKVELILFQEIHKFDKNN